MYLKKNLLGGYKEVDSRDKADLIAYDLKEYEEKDTEIKQLNSLLENEKKERKEKEKSLTIRN